MMAKQRLTPWFPPTVKPARKGWYDFHSFADSSIPLGSTSRMAWWTGRHWLFYPVDGSLLADHHNTGWRGLAENPNA